jgi:hypothetical protein
MPRLVRDQRMEKKKNSAKGITLFIISIRSGRRHNGQDSQDIFVETIYSASSSVIKSRSNPETAGNKGESIRWIVVQHREVAERGTSRYARFWIS